MWSTSFLWDSLSQIFTLIVSLVGLFVVATAWLTTPAGPKRRKLVGGLLLFWLAMIGLVTADHVVNLFLFWEATSFISFFLIGFYSDQEKSRNNALQALVITSIGGLSLLLALVGMSLSAGSFYLSDWGAETQFSFAFITFIFIAAMTKSAIYPLHFWLPNAMVAPAPVSAFLHSAAMVKAGFFLLLRMGPWMTWDSSLASGVEILALVGSLWAAFLAFREVEVKRALAFTTLSQLGLFVAAVVWSRGVFTPTLRALFVAHAFYKSGLFLSGGLADRIAGIKSFDVQSSRKVESPAVALAVWTFSISALGIPPLIGFFAKEQLFATGAEAHGNLFLVFLFLISLFQATVALRMMKLFSLRRSDRKPVEAKFLLGLACLSIAAPFFFQGSFSLLIEGVLKPKFLISMLVLLVAFFLSRTFLSIRERRGLSRLFFDVFDGLKRFADLTTSFVHSRVTRKDLMWALLPLSFLLLVNSNFPSSDLVFTQRDLLLALWMIGGLIITIRSQTPLQILLGLGVVGLGVSLLFSSFGAPDVALTQLLVETLGLVLMVVALKKFPSLKVRSKKLPIIRDLLIATAFGIGMTFLLWETQNVARSEDLKGYFLKEAFATGRGNNVVNVILVDIRALDTLGEISVLAIAALSIAAVWTAARREVS